MYHGRSSNARNPSFAYGSPSTSGTPWSSSHARSSDETCSFWFDFGSRHLLACTEVFVPLSQNHGDEALAVRPHWQSGPSPYNGRVLFENAPVEDVFVVRTLLWFTDHVLYGSAAQALADVPQPKTETERILYAALASSSGGHEERLSNPLDSSLVTVPVANLVDAGFVALVGGRSLACFAQSNGYFRQSDFVDGLTGAFSARYQLVPLEDALQDRNN